MVLVEERDMPFCLQKMQLHQRENLKDDMEVIRVPGGWIYTFKSHGKLAGVTFVPFNDEFDDRGSG
jgi:hypothetical protein